MSSTSHPRRRSLPQVDKLQEAEEAGAQAEREARSKLLTAQQHLSLALSLRSGLLQQEDELVALVAQEEPMKEGLQVGLAGRKAPRTMCALILCALIVSNVFKQNIPLKVCVKFLIIQLN